MSTVLAVEKAGRAAIAWDGMQSHGRERCVGVMGPMKAVQTGTSWIGCAGLAVYYVLLDHYLATQQSSPELNEQRAILSFFLRFWRDLRNDYHLVADQRESDQPSPFADLDAEFLIAGPSGLFTVKPILSVTRYKRFCAIGSGSRHAEGALQVLYDLDLSAPEIARRAMDVALAFDAASGPPVEVREIEQGRT